MLVTAFGIGFALLLFYQLTILGLRQRHFWFYCGLVVCLPRVLADRRLRLLHAAGALPPGPTTPRGTPARGAAGGRR